MECLVSDKAYNAWNAERMRVYRQNMTDEQKEHRRAYQRAYYRAHKEESLAYDREYRRKKKDKEAQR